MVCPILGNPLENSIFLLKQQNSSWRHEEQGLKSNTRHTLRNTWTFASIRGTNYCQPNVSDVIQFLMQLYDSGLSYSTLNTARAAVSAVAQLTNGNSVGSHPLVARFLKGVYQSRTPTPNYSHIYGTYRPEHPVPFGCHNFEKPYIKVADVIVVVTGKRGQTIHMLSLEGMTLTGFYCEFQILHHTKTSKPGNENSNILIRAYNNDKKICPVTTLFEYLKTTKSLRNHEQRLFISYIQPHHKVSRDTISRWAKSVLDIAGIETSIFTGHSTRAAAVSEAKEKDIPLDLILKTVGWKSENTFRTFYDKPIIETVDMGAALLSS